MKDPDKLARAVRKVAIAEAVRRVAIAELRVTMEERSETTAGNARAELERVCAAYGYDPDSGVSAADWIAARLNELDDLRWRFGGRRCRS